MRILTILFIFLFANCAPTVSRIAIDESYNPDYGYVELYRVRNSTASLAALLIIDTGDVIESDQLLDKKYIFRFRQVAGKIVKIKFRGENGIITYWDPSAFIKVHVNSDVRIGRDRIIRLTEGEFDSFLVKTNLSYTELSKHLEFIVKGVEIGRIGANGTLRWAKPPGKFKLHGKDDFYTPNSYGFSQELEVKKGELLKLKVESTNYIGVLFTLDN